MNVKGCCVTMGVQLNYADHCKEHGNDCPDVVVRKNSAGKYRLVAENATYICSFCPWCGKDLT